MILDLLEQTALILEKKKSYQNVFAAHYAKLFYWCNCCVVFCNEWFCQVAEALEFSSWWIFLLAGARLHGSVWHTLNPAVGSNWDSFSYSPLLLAPTHESCFPFPSSKMMTLLLLLLLSSFSLLPFHLFLPSKCLGRNWCVESEANHLSAARLQFIIILSTTAFNWILSNSPDSPHFAVDGIEEILAEIFLPSPPSVPFHHCVFSVSLSFSLSGHLSELKVML